MITSFIIRYLIWQAHNGSWGVGPIGRFGPSEATADIEALSEMPRNPPAHDTMHLSHSGAGGRCILAEVRKHVHSDSDN